MQIVVELQALIGKMESEFITDKNNDEAEVNYTPEYVISKLNEIKSFISNHDESNLI
jgi:hypothetical protein